MSSAIQSIQWNYPYKRKFQVITASKQISSLQELLDADAEKKVLNHGNVTAEVKFSPNPATPKGTRDIAVTFDRKAVTDASLDVVKISAHLAKVDIVSILTPENAIFLLLGNTLYKVYEENLVEL